MSYYWFNREELLKKQKKSIAIKGLKKRLLSTMKTIKRCYKKRQEISINI